MITIRQLRRRRAPDVFRARWLWEQEDVVLLQVWQRSSRRVTKTQMLATFPASEPKWKRICREFKFRCLQLLPAFAPKEEEECKIGKSWCYGPIAHEVASRRDHCARGRLVLALTEALEGAADDGDAELAKMMAMRILKAKSPVTGRTIPRLMTPKPRKPDDWLEE